MTLATINWRRDVFSRTMLVCVFTGFASGLPLYTLINLLPAWLRSEGVDLKSIGLFALIGLPYTWKFLWSPLLDRYALPLLGRRRGWMLTTQLALLGSLALLGLFDPKQDIWSIAGLALAVAFFSASQDIVLDAFRREILSDVQLGLGNTVHINAYRLAGLVPGSLSLILADHLDWGSVFVVTALFMLPGALMTLMVKEPAQAPGSPKTLREAVVEPFHEFLTRQGWQGALWILSFIFLYKLGDSMATSLATPFYLDMGYAKSQIGLVAKHAALWPAVIGGLLGGLWMIKLGINRALWAFGVVQVVSILGFAWLSSYGRFGSVGATELSMLAVVIAFEALGVGLGTAAFVAFIARSTHPAYTATQFALFTSLAAVPRTLANAATGYIVDSVGWTSFFFLCTALALPGMMLLVRVAPWGDDPAPEKA
ncbi:AmpG family muropeptide MFS transporter [Chromobacterium vaccinii]|uniref:AmpG family muropeptide MFS transporter n=1 Tax=Chromobacterium vaccinii TaxID=1108595 RepID=UPI000E180CE2|nr:AmpG family muropeptide MFS transporter [Chromobacterium vaccinii]QND83107.1 AmpG family muropeptide MFS transporter [Chromobacterium vaccinii]QND88338.1 AmpG family muropeptide MFS transporter [Chromobacterium vaccinii]SUX54467.1 muropeptide transporter [Chromobacterium vaccinii]